ncbi:hypothetical protein [Coleofasciculus sp. FACHB-1120]|uniref:hypothetical protein n=1 Tax=Coleofasciculus sp. FACHB-1120 TaxID=2692783 RepID=UPI001687B2BC|nr:hypothetical protein [Coleofasciculus sp. FACHB-1120]MBD2742869.1 hypothetical protein [Coleofasciculus sp. FACHB-1120]
MSEEPKSQGWFHTVPGIMTATAAILTAVTGLVIALKPAEVPKPSPAASTAPSIEAPSQQVSTPENTGNTQFDGRGKGKSKDKDKNK